MAQPSTAPAPGRRSPLRHQLLIAGLARWVINSARRFPYPFALPLAQALDLPLTGVTGCLALSQAVSLLSPLFGPLGDRWGYRQLMLAALAVLAVGCGALVLAPSPWLFAAALLAVGLAKSLYDPALQAYVGASIPYRRRGFAMGVSETAWAGAALLGIPAAGALTTLWGWRAPFAAVAVLAVLSGLVLGVALPRQRRRAAAPGVASWKRVFAYPVTRGALAFGFLISAANDALFVVYGAWLSQVFGLQVSALGVATMVIGAAELLGEGTTAAFSDRWGLRRATLAAAGLTAVAYAVLPLSGANLAGALGALGVLFVCYEFCIVTSFSLCSELLPESRGTMMSAYMAALGSGRMLGALTGGLLWERVGLSGATTFAAGATLLGLTCLARGYRADAPAVGRS